MVLVRSRSLVKYSLGVYATFIGLAASNTLGSLRTFAATRSDDCNADEVAFEPFSSNSCFLQSTCARKTPKAEYGPSLRLVQSVLYLLLSVGFPQRRKSTSLFARHERVDFQSWRSPSRRAAGKASFGRHRPSNILSIFHLCA